MMAICLRAKGLTAKCVLTKYLLRFKLERDETLQRQGDNLSIKANTSIGNDIFVNSVNI
jgi:hypothetical protein